MKRFSLVVALFLLFANLAPAQGATIKAGTKCSKFGQSAIYAGKKFTCIKKSGKLLWNSGVLIKKPEVITAGICPAKLAADLTTGITQKRANALISMTESDSLDCANKMGWDYRVGQRDDEIFAVTLDYSASRVTTTIKNGLVTQVQVG